MSLGFFPSPIYRNLPLYMPDRPHGDSRSRSLSTSSIYLLKRKSPASAGLSNPDFFRAPGRGAEREARGGRRREAGHGTYGMSLGDPGRVRLPRMPAVSRFPYAPTSRSRQPRAGFLKPKTSGLGVNWELL